MSRTLLPLRADPRPSPPSSASPSLTGAADEPASPRSSTARTSPAGKATRTLWSVEDGAITGHRPPTRSRSSTTSSSSGAAGKPKNFELKAKVQLVGNNNSGIQYRSKQLHGRGRVRRRRLPDGRPPRAQLQRHALRRARARHHRRGRPEDRHRREGQEARVARASKPKPVKLDEWNDYAVIAKGNHLVHKLNGETTVDVVDHQADRARARRDHRPPGPRRPGDEGPVQGHPPRRPSPTAASSPRPRPRSRPTPRRSTPPRRRPRPLARRRPPAGPGPEPTPARAS